MPLLVRKLSIHIKPTVLLLFEGRKFVMHTSNLVCIQKISLELHGVFREGNDFELLPLVGDGPIQNIGFGIVFSLGTVGGVQ